MTSNRRTRLNDLNASLKAGATRKEQAMGLTLEQIDRLNSKVAIPKLDEVTEEEAQRIIITREDGSKVSLFNAIYADIEWLHASQLRHLRRLERLGILGGH
jgi:hypothetical protein